ncbi:hypothetical protein UO65_2372 [Actinokineospora spheciospongiae]|uniref:Uncharacterized protein n=1 Tax=Actinokineospora spheciospongiae TaxID=909613 RepID=W7INC8_9PSEU|nr:hypothetical protein UO65_2372 [Actinokineospora spheciospongiae]
MGIVRERGRQLPHLVTPAGEVRRGRRELTRDHDRRGLPLVHVDAPVHGTGLEHRSADRVRQLVDHAETRPVHGTPPAQNPPA